MTKNIKISNLTKIFGPNPILLLGSISFLRSSSKKTIALEDINMHIKNGEITGILGKNGAGKSTLLSTIAGLYIPTNGEIYTNGKIVSVIGLANGLKEDLSVKDNVYLCSSLYGLNRKKIIERMSDILEFSDLVEQANNQLKTLSLGMIARLVFSIAVHCDCDIMLLDEVTSGIDKDNIEKIKEKVKNLAASGKTFIVASHLPDIISMCDKVFILDRGILIGEGSPADMIERYNKISN